MIGGGGLAAEASGRGIRPSSRRPGLADAEAIAGLANDREAALGMSRLPHPSILPHPSMMAAAGFSEVRPGRIRPTRAGDPSA